MAKHRLKLRQLTKILSSFGVSKDRSRGKGSHVLFWTQFHDGIFTYPVPNRRDVLPCYVAACRRRFRLTPEDGVTDDDFFGRA